MPKKEPKGSEVFNVKLDCFVSSDIRYVIILKCLYIYKQKTLIFSTLYTVHIHGEIYKPEPLMFIS